MHIHNVPNRLHLEIAVRQLRFVSIERVSCCKDLYFKWSDKKVISEILELPFVKALGWGWLLPILLSSVPFIWKFQPVTTLTSTKFERVLFSKEKRLSLKVLGVIGNVIMAFFASIGSYTIYFALYNTKLFKSHYSYIDTTITIIATMFLVSTIILFLVGNFNWKLKAPKYSIFEWILNSREKRLLWVFSFHMVFIVSCFSLLPSSLAGEVTKGNIHFANKTVIITFGVALLITNSFLVAATKAIFKSIIKKFARYTGETFFYEEEDSVRWYIYHLATKDTYLLGDAVNPDDAKVFKTIAKEELLSQRIYVYKIPNESLLNQEVDEG